MNIRDEKIIEKIRNFKPCEDCIGLSNLAKKCEKKKTDSEMLKELDKLIKKIPIEVKINDGIK